LIDGNARFRVAEMRKQRVERSADCALGRGLDEQAVILILTLMLFFISLISAILFSTSVNLIMNAIINFLMSLIDTARVLCVRLMLSTLMSRHAATDGSSNSAAIAREEFAHHTTAARSSHGRNTLVMAIAIAIGVLIVGRCIGVGHEPRGRRALEPLLLRAHRRLNAIQVPHARHGSVGVRLQRGSGRR
jgi:hypothetical protein